MIATLNVDGYSRQTAGNGQYTAKDGYCGVLAVYYDGGCPESSGRGTGAGSYSRAAQWQGKDTRSSTPNVVEVG